MLLKLRKYTLVMLNNQFNKQYYYSQVRARLFWQKNSFAFQILWFLANCLWCKASSNLRNVLWVDGQWYDKHLRAAIDGTRIIFILSLFEANRRRTFDVLLLCSACDVQCFVLAIMDYHFSIIYSTLFFLYTNYIWGNKIFWVKDLI